MPRRRGWLYCIFALECRMTWRLDDPDCGATWDNTHPPVSVGFGMGLVSIFTGCILLEICAERKIPLA
jgi:hypothetical protein